MEYSYKFPAIKGIQANQEFFTTMVPLKLLPKIFLFNEEIEDVPAEFRAQRNLNLSRVPVMGDYILNNPNTYVFSSLTASVDGDMHFEATNGKDIGYLHIDMDSRFLINDGQHRKAAIEYALEKNEKLKNETISIVMYKDKNLKRSQQMFSDLNRYAVTPTRSIGILYDSRDEIANVTKEIVDEIKLFKLFTDKEKSTLAKYSAKAFTLSTIYNSNKIIISNRKIEPKFISKFWKLVFDNISELQMMLNKELRAKEIRNSYIVSHGTFLEAMGLIGSYYYDKDWKECKEKLKGLDEINWSRENSEWKKRIISENGRVVKNVKAVKLTSALIKKKLDIPLTKDEVKLEREFFENGK